MTIDYFAVAVDAAKRAAARIPSAPVAGPQMCDRCGVVPAVTAELYGLCVGCQSIVDTLHERCAVCEIEPVKDGYLPTCGSRVCMDTYEQEVRR